MISNLTTAFVRHRAVVLILLVTFIFLGINAYRELPVEAFPDVTNVTVQIQTLFPGHAAEEWSGW